jgi:hypothetical protein
MTRIERIDADILGFYQLAGSALAYGSAAISVAAIAVIDTPVCNYAPRHTGILGRANSPARGQGCWAVGVFRDQFDYAFARRPRPPDSYLTGFSIEGRRTKIKSPPSCPEFLT